MRWLKTNPGWVHPARLFCSREDFQALYHLAGVGLGATGALVLLGLGLDADGGIGELRSVVPAGHDGTPFLGEEIAIGMLEEQALGYPTDDFVMSVPTFDGEIVRIGRK